MISFNGKPQGTISKVLEAGGYIGGLYYAYTKQSKWYGYLGWAFLGGLVGGVTGNKLDNVFSKSDSKSQVKPGTGPQTGAQTTVGGNTTSTNGPQSAFNANPSETAIEYAKNAFLAQTALALANGVSQQVIDAQTPKIDNFKLTSNFNSLTLPEKNAILELNKQIKPLASSYTAKLIDSKTFIEKSNIITESVFSKYGISNEIGNKIIMSALKK